MKFYRKRTGGTGVMELGPALLVIFVVVLIPMLDLLYLGLAYASGWYCNHLVVREVACQNPTKATAAALQATTAWANSGLAAFIGVTSPGAVTNVPLFQDSGGNTQTPSNPANPAIAYCFVTTSMQIKPFLPIPCLMSVAGINAPVVFSYSAQRPQEEKGLN